MLKQKQTESRKIIIVLSLLVALLIGSFVLREWKRNQLRQKIEVDRRSELSIEITPSDEVLGGSYRIVLDKPKVEVGQIVTAQVVFSLSGRRVSGSDVILKYDPQFLQVEGEVSPGDFFAHYPRTEVDNRAGVVKVTAFQSVSTEPEEADISLFKVKFRTIKEGETLLDFDFEKERTDLTTLVEQGTSRNILERVEGVEVEINNK